MGVMTKKIAVIGVGRLGICWALNLARAGYEVTGIDSNHGYIESLKNRSFHTEEPGVMALLDSVKTFSATTDIKDGIKDASVVFILVNTPSTKEGDFNHAAIDSVVDALIKIPQQKTTHLVISSTVMPGYGEQLQKRLASFNYTVNYNPQLIAQGSILKDQQRPDLVLIGHQTPESGQVISEIHGRVVENKPVFALMSVTSAEITKIGINCFLTAKIAFANLIGDAALSAGADPEAILKAVGSDSRIGNRYLRYGYGYGGPCFPRDNRAFQRFLTKQGLQYKMPDSVDHSNNEHLAIQLQLFESRNILPPGIRRTGEKSVEITGVSYNAKTSSIEESQHLKFAVALTQRGYAVTLKDWTAVLEKVRTQYPDVFSFEQMESNEINFVNLNSGDKNVGG